MPGVAVVVVVVVAAAAAAAAVWRHDVNDMSTREKRSRGSWEGGAGDTQTHAHTRAHTHTRTHCARTHNTHSPAFAAHRPEPLAHWVRWSPRRRSTMARGVSDHAQMRLGR